jgi:hypothetical protein
MARSERLDTITHFTRRWRHATHIRDEHARRGVGSSPYAHEWFTTDE